MKRKPPLLDKPYSRQRTVSPEEKILWEDTITGRPRHVGSEKEANPTSVAKPARAAKKPSSAKLKSPTDSIDTRMRHDIRSGKQMIGAVLDLHGYTQAEAHTRLIDFTQQIQARGIRTALVITGKGRSGEEGILRKSLPRWLQESPLRERIIAYDTASLRHGGSGAWYLRIRII